MDYTAFGYTPTALITVILLGFCGSFQLGFQDVYYDSLTAVQTIKRGATFPQFDSGMFFCFGASVGGIGSVIARRYSSTRISIVGGCAASIVSECLILIAAFYKWYKIFCVFKVIDGICTGYVTCLQINVINDMSLEQHRTMMHLTTSFFVILGQGTSIVLYSLSLHAYLEGPVNIIPHLCAVIFFLLYFTDPPIINALEDAEEDMTKAVKIFYDSKTKDMAIKEIHERIRVLTITGRTALWKKGAVRKALLLSIFVNAVAGMASDRFSWMFLTQLAYNFNYFCLEYAFLGAALGLTMASTVFSYFEHRSAFLISAGIMLASEAVFGPLMFILVNYENKSEELKILITLSRAALICACNMSLGSFAYFIILDLSFSQNSILLVALSFGVRMFFAATSPNLYLTALKTNSLLYTAAAGAPLVLFMAFVYFKFPYIRYASAIQIMTKLCYNLNIDASTEEVEDLRKKLHLLWTQSTEDSVSNFE